MPLETGNFAQMVDRSNITVLVVEDEPLLLMNAAMILESEGFQVVQAMNADQAIDILSSRMDVDVVFTDINMPGSMDGLKLAQAISKRWPPIKLVVTSGKMQPEDIELPDGGRFLSKPYSPAKLLGTLTSLA